MTFRNCFMFCCFSYLFQALICVCLVCGMCGVVWRAEKPPCVHSKRLRAYRHHAYMCFNLCACRHTRRRFECKHGDFQRATPHHNHNHSHNDTHHRPHHRHNTTTRPQHHTETETETDRDKQRQRKKTGTERSGEERR